MKFVNNKDYFVCDLSFFDFSFFDFILAKGNKCSSFSFQLYLLYIIEISMTTISPFCKFYLKISLWEWKAINPKSLDLLEIHLPRKKEEQEKINSFLGLDKWF